MAILHPCNFTGCPELIETEGYCETHRKHMNKQRDIYRGTPAQRGYDYKWTKFRSRYLAKHPLCMDCEERDEVSLATEVHHERSILEYPELKYAESNLKALCETCHARRGAGFWKGKELKKMKYIIVITGPPCSGKSTYVKQHMKPGDLVWDYDEIMKALTGQDLYYRPEWGIDVCAAIRDALYKNIDSSIKVKKVWIITCSPKRYQRNELRKRFDAEVIIIKPDIQVCINRINQDARRPDKAIWVDAITQWYNDYEKGDNEKCRIE